MPPAFHGDRLIGNIDRRVKDGLITDEDMRILEEALLGLKAQYQRSHSHA